MFFYNLFDFLYFDRFDCSWFWKLVYVILDVMQKRDRHTPLWFYLVFLLWIVLSGLIGEAYYTVFIPLLLLILFFTIYFNIKVYKEIKNSEVQNYFLLIVINCLALFFWIFIILYFWFDVLQ